MTSNSKMPIPSLAAIAIGLTLLSSSAYAQVATTLEQAEMAGLSPEVKADIQARYAKGGQTVYELLKTDMLNNIQARLPGATIQALDFNAGVATVLAGGKLQTVKFDTRTLTLQ